MTARPAQILFITATRIGDVVLSSGLIGHMAKLHPGAQFTIAGGGLPLGLFADTPGLAALLPMVKQPNGGHWLTLWRQTRQTRWDHVIDLRGSLTAYGLRARARHVLTGQGRDLHRVVAYAQVVGLEAAPPPPGFFVASETQARADQWLGGPGEILAMAPAANWIGKTWPAERFAALAAGLLGPEGALPNGRLLLLGGKEDVPAAQVVAAGLPPDRVIWAMGAPDLLTTYAMLRRARLFVGNDSGMMHLAAAAQAPTLGLFGPTDDRLYAPWGDHCVVVRAGDFAAFKAIDPHLNRPEPHMASLDLASVKAAALSLLAKTQGAFP